MAEDDDLYLLLEKLGRTDSLSKADIRLDYDRSWSLLSRFKALGREVLEVKKNSEVEVLLKEVRYIDLLKE